MNDSHVTLVAKRLIIAIRKKCLQEVTEIGGTTAGPWSRCGEKQAGCPCGFIFGDGGDVYVARCYGAKDLGEVDPVPLDANQKANSRFMVSARTLTPKMLFGYLDILAECERSIEPVEGLHPFQDGKRVLAIAIIEHLADSLGIEKVGNQAVPATEP